MWGKHAAAAVLLVNTAGSAFAWESLDFRLAGAGDEELLSTVRGAALLTDLEARDEDAAPDVISAAQGDYARVVEALYAQGYYAPVVSILIDGREAATISPLSAPEAINRVEVIVEPGQPFRFGRAEIGPLAHGYDRPEGFRSGQPALATTVRDAAQSAVDGWRLEGHAKARIAGQSITARHREALLDVDVDVDQGPKLTFGDVIVESDSAVKPARIRQIAGIPRGETYSSEDVENAAERLRKTGTFRSVQLTEADRINADASMDILIDVVDRKPRRIGGGAELSSSEGVHLSAFWLHRNFLGGAERFRIDGEVRQLGGAEMRPDYTLSARIERPAVYGADTLGFGQVAFEYLDDPDHIERNFFVSVGASREFSDQLTGELAVSYLRSRVTDLYLPGDPTRDLNVLSLPGKLTLDRRDSPLDATEGFYLDVGVEPFVLLGSSEPGALLSLDTRGYRAFGAEEGVVLAGRLQLGSLSGVAAEDAPPGHLFYSGGGGTVRGHPFESLDVDYGGNRLGGRSFAALSTELRVDVTDNIGVVAFADAGYVGAESFFDGTGEWHAGAGLGARYATPVGPIRVDVAGPISGRTGDGVQLYIGIGQAF